MREVAKTRKLKEPARTDVKKLYECKFALSTHKLLCQLTAYRVKCLNSPIIPRVKHGQSSRPAQVGEDALEGVVAEVHFLQPRQSRAAHHYGIQLVPLQCQTDKLGGCDCHRSDEGVSREVEICERRRG